MAVQEHGVPEGADGLELVDDIVMQVSGIEGTVLHLVHDAVGRIDSGESVIVQGRRGTRIVGIPGMLMHALVHTAVHPAVRARRGDDHVRRLFLGIEHAIPVHHGAELGVRAREEGGHVLVRRLKGLLENLGIGDFVQVETGRKARCGNRKDRYRR